ncbi:hypothetical protein GWI33_005169 [Rhynchophorus ferrugineus]|uniref:Uncharacterized protein n=1 Tax=Rhynchophorus ferrugineus TaxID=354439 RepID=A0A834ME27_RHYFE|nr:hypothetical protein GWI33_005169 [Rhynchophorus ferrugineus]
MSYQEYTYRNEATDDETISEDRLKIPNSRKKKRLKLMKTPQEETDVNQTGCGRGLHHHSIKKKPTPIKTMANSHTKHKGSS